MNIVIKSNELEITEAIKSYAEKKIGEALEKFYDNPRGENIFASVEISKLSNSHTKGDLYKVSVKLSSANKNIFVDVAKEDLYKAIDSLKDKLFLAIKDTRERKTSISRRVASRFKKLFRKGE